MTNAGSMGYLVETASQSIVKARSEWDNPYDDFIELNKKLSGHFRSIGDNYDIGVSRLVWEITQTIAYIAEVFLRLVEKPVTDNRGWLDELINQITWYISFFRAAFDKGQKVDKHYSYEACRQIGLMCLAFYERGFTDVVSSGVSAIGSVAASYHEKGVERSVHGVVELLMVIWHVRILAEAKEDKATTALIDKALKELKIWEGEGADELMSLFEQGKRRLKRELTELGSSLYEDPTSSLRRLLMNKYPAMLQKILNELYPPRPPKD